MTPSSFKSVSLVRIGRAPSFENNAPARSILKISDFAHYKLSSRAEHLDLLDDFSLDCQRWEEERFVAISLGLIVQDAKKHDLLPPAWIGKDGKTHDLLPPVGAWISQCCTTELPKRSQSSLLLFNLDWDAANHPLRSDRTHLDFEREVGEFPRGGPLTRSRAGLGSDSATGGEGGKKKAQLVARTCLEPKWPRPSIPHLGHPHSTIAQDVDIPVLHNGTAEKKPVELASF